MQCLNTKQQFALEIRNRFSALAATTEDDTNTKWDIIKKTHVETVTNNLGYKQRNNKKWITPGTCQKIDETKQLKAKMLSMKSLRFQEQIQQAYKSKDKEVKRSAREDKRSFIEEMASEAEQDGTVLTTEQEQAAK